MRKRILKPMYGMPEQWKRYKDTNYYVSSQGRVSHQLKNGKIYECGFWSNKKGKFLNVKILGKEKRISRIVYETFIGEIPDGYIVVHKNGVLGDNSVYNLKLSLQSEFGKANGYKAKSQKVYCRDNKKIYRSAREAEKNLPISLSTICDICNGKSKAPCMDLYWYDDDNNRIYRGKYARK